MGQHHLGLVGDRQVRAPGGDLLDRRRRFGGGVDRRRRGRLLRSSRASAPCRSRRGRGWGRSRASARTARVRRVMSSDFSPQAARPRPRARSATASGDRLDSGRLHPLLFYRQVTTRRSARATRPNRTSAIAERTTTAANSPRRLELGVVAEDQVAEAGAGAGPLAEDGADQRDDDGDLGAAEGVGQRGRRLDPAQDLPAGGVEACASS